MKKLIAALVGAVMLVPGTAMVTATSAAAAPAYQPTVDTNVKISGVPKKLKKGTKRKIVATLNADADPSVCTGEFVLIIKKGSKLLKQARKPANVASRTFGYKFKAKGKNLVKVKYQRGEQDPCAKSVATKKVRVKK